MLSDGEDVGEDLAGVEQVGESVDHRDGCVFRQLFDVGVGEGTNHDAVDVAGKDARGVGNGLTTPELDIARRQEQGVAAELVGAHLEGDASTRG